MHKHALVRGPAVLVWNSFAYLDTCSEDATVGERAGGFPLVIILLFALVASLGAAIVVFGCVTLGSRVAVCTFFSYLSFDD